MTRDRALAVAVAGTIAYAVAVGTMSSKPGAPVTVARPVAMYATFFETGQTLPIRDPSHIEAVAQWLDDAMANPRSAFDLRVLPPPVNELAVEFESGERTTIHFSGRTGDDPDAEALRRIRYPEPVYVVKHDGALFTADWVPDVLEGYLEMTENPPSRTSAYVPEYQVKPDR